MSCIHVIQIEFLKIKRSRSMVLFIILPFFDIIAGMVHIGEYISPTYANPWEAMFIQCSLLFSYYLLPFSMVIVSVLISNKEFQHNGMLKLLALPLEKWKVVIGKLCVFVSFLFLQIIIFIIIFVVLGSITSLFAGVKEPLPLLYLCQWIGTLFLSSLPVLFVMWALTVVFEKKVVSIGLNFLLIIPGILVANTKAWFMYPYCYSGYMLTNALVNMIKGTNLGIDVGLVLPTASVLSVVAIVLAIRYFGRTEMK